MTGPGDLSPDDMALAGIRSGQWLDGQEFAPLRYAVPGLLPEGFTLLVGGPKIGKSKLVLGKLLAVASGGMALSAVKCGPPRPVLYVSLEDGDRRMQTRIREHLAPGEPIPPTFDYLLKIDPAIGLINTVRAWLRRHDDAAMVVIDTLQKAIANLRGPAGEALARERNTYARDYMVGGWVASLCRPGLSVTACHHARKSYGEGTPDFVERVSGTQGYAGSADAIMVLDRARYAEEGLLHVTGRDIPEASYALKFPRFLQWQLDGDDLRAAASRAITREAEIRLGSDDMIAIRAAVYARPVDGLKTGELTAMFPALTDKKLSTYLGRLVDSGDLIKPRRGWYLPAVNPNGTHTPNTPNTPNTDDEADGDNWPPW